MKVRNKETEEVYKVYNIKDNKDNYPLFLIYSKNKWIYMSAKFYEPVEEDI